MTLRNVGITPGDGDNTRFDDGNQVVKVAYGAEGVETLMAEKPATEAGQTTGNASLASIDGKTATLVASNPAATASAVPVRQAPARVFRCSFADVGAGLLSTDFSQIGSTGTGIGVNQTGGNLVITSGTTANAELLMRSVFAINGAHIMRWGAVLSQRIAQNNFHIMLADSIGNGLSCTVNSATSITVTIPSNPFTAQNVGQFMFVGAISGVNGVPGRYAIASVSGNNVTFTVAGWPASGSCTVSLFGWNYHRVLYTSTTATNASYDAQRKGWASGDTTATINSTASPGHVGMLQCDCSDAAFSDSLRASSTGYQFSQRATRVENLPDQDTVLYAYVWVQNGSTNPASSTTFTLNFVSLEDLSNQKVYVAGATRGQVPAAVAVQGTVPVSGTVTVTTTTNIPATGQGSSTALRRLLTADTNAANVKNGAGVIGHLSVYNDSATKFYLKLYNLTTVPNLASNTPEMTIPVPAGANVQVDCGPFGLRFATGISIAVVRGIADTDTTAVVANDGVVCMRYT